ncbi:MULTISPECIES: hypothetical protein [Pseudomonas]|uniref:Uncharacterized protein n=2 Tax=Pseudomonas chlororaphis TaxID=587753 RepID=A0AAQ2YFB9_9PSED|nr:MULTISPECIES: hypothetical protein [Pseudomonas]AIS13369.1 hypothetical protein JM49_17450 [Pseudomonas chlororaphis subsp. aurantiaca]AVO58764.1 hypothetical protein C6Q18_12620 [Pseudomonas chlororaphis subsp. piscium]AZC37065.1 hypothetical protein C4K37_2678 [Pseudomonas chlororaphis subsp. piscium]AZC43611.1 hypothetical protein C4K36_2686 [Pseudomonas chlororaphis subsp. piscium]AZC50301.1 hypothetical protein C4K35_2718 [Pseudomonas chlororaphis subsp. piscium]
MASIMKVLDIHLSLLKSNPPQLHILAHGLVGSPGWTNPRLQPRFYIDFPKDGIQDFDFVADPPQGVSILPVYPITASEHWENPPLKKLKGVRVHSANNFVEEYIQGAKSVAC